LTIGPSRQEEACRDQVEPLMNDERLIRALIEARVAAMAAGHGAAAVADLSPELVAFELAGPLVVPASVAASAEAAQTWLDSWESRPETEMRDLAIHVSGDVAFCHSLNRLKGLRKDGKAVDFWMRSTLGLRRIDGEWRIVHGHSSVPFQMDGSFRAALDLQPPVDPGTASAHAPSAS
jgi:ketosteroid isomerase-like protein